MTDQVPRHMWIHLVRHGESTWNALGLLQGQTMHVGLSKMGLRQAEAVAAAMAGLSLTSLITSDQKRAVQTADLIGKALGLRPTLDARLRERGRGILEGRPSWEVLSQTIGVDWTDPNVRVGGGESIADVHARVTDLCRSILATADRDVALVSHGDTIRIAVSVLAGRGPDDVRWTDVPNGSVIATRGCKRTCHFV